MFVSDAAILLKVSVLLKKIDPTTGESTLPAYWSVIVADAHQNAYNTILSRLSARGFVLSQILAWDRGPEFEKDLAVWWALSEGAGTLEQETRVPTAIDRSEELMTVEVTNLGVAVDPQGPQGICRTGPRAAEQIPHTPFSPLRPRGQQFRDPLSFTLD